MAQRKPPTKQAARKSPPPDRAGRSGAARPPAKKKPGKSIVNQKQTPWGLIVTTAVIVIFAAGIVAFAVTRHHSSNAQSSSTATTVDKNDPYRQPELADAKAIAGVTYRVEASHNHVEGILQYDSSPPVGGNHSQYWADCTGTVYPNAIANENAVHMLEHGAVWITYKPGLAKADVDNLAKLVTGQDRMAMSPYPNLKSAVSLQAWGYQLFVNSPTDPRIQQFIDALRFNPKTTPEPSATCSQPSFKTHPSTFGHPLWVPAGP
jgi:hypothetical protein